MKNNILTYQILKENEREQQLESVLVRVLFELSSMPPFPGTNQIPFGISHSCEIIREALKK